MTAQAHLPCIEPRRVTRPMTLEERAETAAAFLAMLRGELSRVGFEVVLRGVGR